MKTSGLLLALVTLLAATSARSDPPDPRLQNCTSGVSPGLRQECDRQATEQVGIGSRITPLSGGWQLVQSRNPGGGSDAVSVMHVADTTRSDVSLAGLNFQCGRESVDVVLVILDRLSRTSRPKVILAAGSSRAEFEASVVQSGEALLLPNAAANLAAAEWQKASELAIEIETQAGAIRGAVPMDGLSAALQTLKSRCPVH
jgi:hypothetical protein